MKAQLLFLCALIMSHLSAHNNQELFLHAGELYARGEYAKALEAYAQVDASGSAVWFNRAMTHLHLGNMVDAQLCLARALKYAPSRKLYQRIYEQQCKLFQPKQNSFISAATHELIGCSRVMSLFLLQLLFLALLYLGIVLWWLARRWWLLAPLLCCLAAVMCAAYYDRQPYVFVRQEVSMHAGKQVSFSSVATLHQGQVARLERSEGDWLQLVYHGVRGWVRAEDVVII